MGKDFIPDLTDNDVTPHEVFRQRRRIIKAAGLVALAGPFTLATAGAGKEAQERLKPTAYEAITSYNNFYEFGPSKSDPARYAHTLTTRPWHVTIDGLVEKPGVWPLEKVLDGMTIEERIYRFRCVEGWSMVVPWNGFMLRDLLKRVGVRREAKYVAFETLKRPSEMPGQKTPLLDWPYREGLRLDEAMHPLTLLATGLYGKPMPNQNGAPLRLVVPWKYGFKSIKSIVRITLTDKQPPTTWSGLQPHEYGFYANVNPKVSHPRWSQATERPLGGGLFARRVPTLMFNGYEKQVARLYAGMDLRKFY